MPPPGLPRTDSRLPPLLAQATSPTRFLEPFSAIVWPCLALEVKLFRAPPASPLIQCFPLPTVLKAIDHPALEN